MAAVAGASPASGSGHLAGVFSPMAVATSIEHQKTNSAGKVLPLVLQPNEGSAADISLQDYVSTNRDTLLDLAAGHGAVLLRGFGLSSVEDFASVFESFNIGLMPYIGGAAVRTSLVEDIVLTANESPATEPIPPHHELSQTESPPDFIAFFCEVPAEKGGETPLFDSRAIARFVREKHPELHASLAEHGVRYVRVMPAQDDPKSAIGRSWKNTYNCSTRAAAEAAMTGAGTAFEWLGEGEDADVRTTTKALPAIRKAPGSGEEVFFNSIIAAFNGWIDSRNPDPSKAVQLGNGEPIEEAALKSISEFAMANAVAVPWQKGDVLFVNNHVTMHSRNPFEGDRKVSAAIGRGVLPTKAKAAEAQAALPVFTLPRTGDKMPALGLGMWKVPNAVCATQVANAIRAGWRQFDCAEDYGNEKEVGEGIALALRRGYISDRKELFIVSKLWNTYHRAEHAGAAMDRTLADLGVEYVDLFLVHFPISLKFVPMEERYPPGWIYDDKAEHPKMEPDSVSVRETWAAMEAFVEAGKARNIGLSNFNTQGVREVLTFATIKPQVLQVELHPQLQQTKLLRFAKEHGIVVTGFSPLGSGSYVELGMATATDSVLVSPVITGIAEKHGVTPAQVCLRWGVQRGTTLVPKTSKAHRLFENLASQAFELDDDDMSSIASLDRGKRYNDPGVFCELAFGCFYPIYE